MTVGLEVLLEYVWAAFLCVVAYQQSLIKDIKTTLHARESIVSEHDTRLAVMESSHKRSEQHLSRIEDSLRRIEDKLDGKADK